jgi:hypothetical protein
MDDYPRTLETRNTQPATRDPDPRHLLALRSPEGEEGNRIKKGAIKAPFFMLFMASDFSVLDPCFSQFLI